MARMGAVLMTSEQFADYAPHTVPDAVETIRAQLGENGLPESFETGEDWTGWTDRW